VRVAQVVQPDGGHLAAPLDVPHEPPGDVLRIAERVLRIAEREAREWSRNELARRMADAAGSAVTAPAHVLESYLSRWEAGNVPISARYRQLLDAVLGPGANAPAVHPPYMPIPDPRQWVRAMRAIESDIADGQWKPGDQLPVRSALAQRYGLSADAVMRAQDELLRASVLHRGQVYGALYVSDAEDQQPPGAPAPGPGDQGGCRAPIQSPAAAGDLPLGDGLG
jgi:transcriptional regulator with XRE-family HTH domain